MEMKTETDRQREACIERESRQTCKRTEREIETNKQRRRDREKEKKTETETETNKKTHKKILFNISDDPYRFLLIFSSFCFFNNIVLLLFHIICRHVFEKAESMIFSITSYIYTTIDDIMHLHCTIHLVIYSWVYDLFAEQ